MLKLMYNGNTVTCGGGFVSFPDPAHFVTLIQNTGGTIAANTSSGIPGDIVTLSNTPDVGYNFDNYSITGAILTGDQFAFGNSDVSAEGLFSRKAYTLTLQNDGHGTIGATKTTGYAGDTVTLSNSHNTYYRFNNYTQTGGSLNDSTFTFGDTDATAKANFKINYFTATGNFNFATGAAGAGVASWSRNCDGIIRAHTGSLPSEWGSNGSKFNPSNASSYKINWNTTLHFQSNNLYKGSKPMTGYNRIYCGSTNVKTTTCTIAGSKTGNSAKANTNNNGNSTIQGHPYMNAAIGSTTARTQMNCTSCSPNGWTATGIAP